MSRQISVGKQVVAIQALPGEHYYFLLEKVYSSDESPEKARWETLCLGTAEQALEVIFERAALAAKAELTGVAKRFAADAYAQAWLKALTYPKRAVANQSMALVCKSTDTPRKGEVAREKLTAAKDQLIAEGFGQMVYDLDRAGRYTIESLEREVHGLAILLKRALPYELLDMGTLAFENASWSGWHGGPAAQMPSYQLPGSHRLHGLYTELVLVEHGGWLTVLGDIDTVLASFIRGYAQFEITNPGYFDVALHKMRTHLTSLPVIGDDSLVEIELDNADADHFESAARVWKSMGQRPRTLGDMLAEDIDALRSLHGAVRFLPADGNGLTPLGQMVLLGSVYQ